MVLSVIKALAEKQGVSIKHLIHRALPAWEPARSHKILHASDLMKEHEFCPREFALFDLSPQTKPKGRFIGTAQHITYAHGKDMERRLRNDWLREHVVGYWDCGVCGLHLQTFGKSPKLNCPECHVVGRWVYREPRFDSKISGISGGIDAIVDVGQTVHRMVEIKSIDKDYFKDLVAPYAEHRFRASLYLRLAAESDDPIAKRLNKKVLHILYVSKSYGFKDTSLAQAGIKDEPFSPFKEYVVERDDSLTETAVAKAKALHYFRKNSKKPSAVTFIPCGVCVSALTKRAEACPVRAQCFSGSYPGSITWVENAKIRHPGKELPPEE